MLQMLTAARETDAQEIPRASVANVLDRAFPKTTKEITSSETPNETPLLDTIPKGGVEVNNMIGSVEITGSSITDAIIECLYGPYCPKQTTIVTPPSN